MIGSVAGPHPYPMMVRDFQAVIGHEARRQIRRAAGRLPDACIACVGGGSNAIGLFHAFRDDRGVELIGVEAAGHGLETGAHAASLTAGQVGVLHGNKTYLLQDETGQIRERALDLRRARLSRRRPRARLAARQRPRARTSPSPTTRRSRRSGC